MKLLLVFCAFSLGHERERRGVESEASICFMGGTRRVLGGTGKAKTRRPARRGIARAVSPKKIGKKERKCPNSISLAGMVIGPFLDPIDEISHKQRQSKEEGNHNDKLRSPKLRRRRKGHGTKFGSKPRLSDFVGKPHDRSRMARQPLGRSLLERASCLQNPVLRSEELNIGHRQTGGSARQAQWSGWGRPSLIARQSLSGALPAYLGSGLRNCTGVTCAKRISQSSAPDKSTTLIRCIQARCSLTRSAFFHRTLATNMSLVSASVPSTT
jgi:hypothetical protein